MSSISLRSNASIQVLAAIATASLLAACVLEEDVGSNDPDDGTGGTAGSGATGTAGTGATGGTAGSGATGGTAGTGATGGTAGSGATGGTGGSAADPWQTLAVSFNAHSLRAVGNDIYWTTLGDTDNPPAGGGFYRIAKTSSWISGSPIIQGETVSYFGGSARSFCVDGDSAIIWSTILDLGYSGSNIESVSLSSGGGIELFDMGIAIPADIGGRDQVIAIDDTYLYFPCEDYWWDDGICRGKKDGTGELELLASAPPTYLTNLTVTSTHVYWTSYGGTAFPGSLDRVAKGTPYGTVEHIADLPEMPTSMLTQGDDVYVYAVELKHGMPSDPAVETGTIYRFVDGQGPGQELATLEARGGRLASDGTHLYFGDGGMSLDLFRVQLTGGALETMLTESHDHLVIGDVEVDATHVYWIAEGEGSYADLIRRAPKP